MVVACAALLVALGGTSIAAVSAFPAGSVGTIQLKDRAVTNQKIADNAVGTTKVKNGSLLKGDFRAGQLPAGPRGFPGLPGAQGPSGPSGPSRPVRPHQHDHRADGKRGGSRRRGRGRQVQHARRLGQLLAGEKAISASAGWSADDDNLELTTVGIKPQISNGIVTGYLAKGGNDSGDTTNFTLFVDCYK